MAPRLPQILAGLLLLSALFFVLERAFGNSRGKPVLRAQWGTDTLWWFFVPLVNKWFTRGAILIPAALLVLLGVADPDHLRDRLYHGFGPLGAQPVWLQVIQIYLLVDLCSYWSHRWFHRGRLWPFHAVHHSSEDLDWLSSVRVHPVNEFGTKLCQVAPLLLLGYDPLAAGSAPVFLTFYAILLHANVDWTFGPLRYVVATPVFHRWHHSRDAAAWNRNFAGLFPFWDLLFGTFYMPRGRRPENFGIHDAMPPGFPGQLLYPFRRQAAPQTAIH